MQKGRNISSENYYFIFDFINNLEPKNNKEKRNKLILELAFIKNMSALQIAKMKHPLIVSHGNRSKGKYLTNVQISRIINSYGLVYEKRIDTTKKKNYARRKELTKQINKGVFYNKPKICAVCGCCNGLELHHLVAIKNGGKDDFDNLIWLCKEHHKKVTFARNDI